MSEDVHIKDGDYPHAEAWFSWVEPALSPAPTVSASFPTTRIFHCGLRIDARSFD